MARAILRRRSDDLHGYQGDRLFGEVVRREIALDSARWRDDAVDLVRLARMAFRFLTSAFNAAMDALIALGNARDPTVGELQAIHQEALIGRPWLGWDIAAKAGVSGGAVWCRCGEIR